jgi:hypothetical protein
MALFPQSAIVLVVLCLLSAFDVYAGQARTARGLFVETSGHRAELTAYAEAVESGGLQMASGRLENVPAIALSRDVRIFCRLPNWQPSRVMLGSAAVFEENGGELRELQVAVRRVDVSAFEVHVTTFEHPGEVARLLAAAQVRPQEPAYLFVVMTSGDSERFYPVRLKRQASR